MKFIKVNSTNDCDFLEMYPEYVAILQKYDGDIEIPTEYSTKLRYKLDNSEVYLLQHQENIVGFVILGFGLKNSFSGHDIFIEEFFIKSEYQRARLGSLAVMELVKKYSDCDFSAFIIENNIIAQNFWEITFARCGYIERTLAGHITAKYENLLFKYWVKNREDD